MTTINVRITITRKAGKPKGIILYRGPSALDGSPIVVVAILRKSKNAKTGDMLPVYILADGVDPLEALRTGADRAVCGSCPLKGEACYVNVAQAPLAIYRALQAGKYVRLNRKSHAKYFKGRFVRMGAYGDPAAAPLAIWQWLAKNSEGHTGYTHQWKTCDEGFKALLMASCETEAQRLDAVAAGWRTFRVRREGAPLMEGEFVCPASAEAGKRLTCSGAKGGASASPAIVVHGPAIANNWKQRMFNAAADRIEALEVSRRFTLN